MRTMIAMFFVLIALLSPRAYGQEAEPSLEELRQRAEILQATADARAQIAAIEAAGPGQVAEPVGMNSPRRHHVYVSGCGVDILNQPANGRHTERMMAQIRACMDAETRRLEASNRGELSMAAIQMDRNLFAEGDTVAVGQAATYAAMADGNVGLGMLPGDSVAWGLSRVHAMSALQGLETQNLGAVPAPVTKTPSVTRPAPPLATPVTTTPPVDKASQAKSDLFKE